MQRMAKDWRLLAGWWTWMATACTCSAHWVLEEPDETVKELVQTNRRLYARMAEDSSRGVHRALEGTDHVGVVTHEPQARRVVEAIREVLEVAAASIGG
jgi:hypothetical protein